MPLNTDSMTFRNCADAGSGTSSIQCARSPLVKNGGHISQVNPVDVGVSALTAGLGVGGNVWWNIGVGTAAGGLQAEINNLVYNQNNNVLVNAATGRVTTGAGFLVGDKFTGIMATQNSTSLNPVIAGNALSAWITKSVNAALEHESKQGDKLPAEKK